MHVACACLSYVFVFQNISCFDDVSLIIMDYFGLDLISPKPMKEIEITEP